MGASCVVDTATPAPSPFHRSTTATKLIGEKNSLKQTSDQLPLAAGKSIEALLAVPVEANVSAQHSLAKLGLKQKKLLDEQLELVREQRYLTLLQTMKAEEELHRMGLMAPSLEANETGLQLRANL